MQKLLALVLLFMLITPPAFADEFDYKSQEFKEVASQFMCMCGCGQDHFECNMQGCGLNDSFKAEIREMMEEGLTSNEIKDYYLGMYGEEILTAPEKKGFSLTAWVLPFAVLGIAGTGIVYAIRKWVTGYAEEESPYTQTQQCETEDEIVKSMIDEERKKYF